MKRILLFLIITLFFTLGGKSQVIIPIERFDEPKYLPNQFADYVQWCKDNEEKKKIHFAASIGSNLVDKAVVMISPTIYSLRVRDDFKLTPTVFYNITFDTGIGNQLGYGIRVDSNRFTISYSGPITKNGDTFIGVGYNL